MSQKANTKPRPTLCVDHGSENKTSQSEQSDNVRLVGRDPLLLIRLPDTDQSEGRNGVQLARLDEASYEFDAFGATLTCAARAGG